MFHFEDWISNTDSKYLKQTFESLLHEIDFKIISFTDHNFPVEGYTCVWLLAESHLAIHTFPKDNVSFIQLSSCNLKKKNQFEMLFSKLK